MSSDNTIPDGTVIPHDHTWCPIDRPYPVSYAAAIAQNPALCVVDDPCSPDGATTLWTVQPCTVLTRDPGYPMVKEPTTLPATGVDIPAPLFGGTLAIIAGIALVRLELRGRRT